MNTFIKVAGKSFDTGCRVVLWDEPGGLNFYPHGGFHPRNWNLKQCRENIDSLYFHHSVTYHAQSMFTGLKARGLSCNFMIDDDVNEDGCATIFQCLDVADAGWSQGGIHNHKGAGIEVSYMPDAWDNPNRYSHSNITKFGVQPHSTIPETVQGMKFSKVFAPTDAQIRSCIAITMAYKEAFPDLKLEFPKDSNGNILQKQVSDPDNASGLLHHFHIRRDKIDPMGFPTAEMEQEVNRLEKLRKNESSFILNRIISIFKR